MTGGLIQIVAYGSQDLFLTGIPEITFFKYIYKRYTNFSLESINVDFDGVKNFDEEIVCTIPKNGDIIKDIFLRFDIPTVNISKTTKDNTSIQNKLNLKLEAENKYTNFKNFINFIYECIKIINTNLNQSNSTFTNLNTEVNNYLDSQSNYLSIKNKVDVSISKYFNIVQTLTDINGLVLNDVQKKNEAEKMINDYLFHSKRFDKDLNDDIFQKTIEYNKENTDFYNFSWINNLAYQLIERVELHIGGNVIDRQYGKWIYIWNQLCGNKYKQEILKKLYGDIESNITYNTDSKKSFTIFIPLIFWFNRNYGLGLPLISLRFQDIKLFLKISKLDKCIYTDYPNTDNDLIDLIKLSNCSALIEYIYLDSDERKKFAKSSHEYLIEETNLNNYKLNIKNELNLDLDFSHPIKYLVWTVQSSSDLDNNLHFYFTSELNYNLTNNYPVITKNEGNTVNSASIELNGINRINDLDGTYFNFIQPLEGFNNTPSDGINTYSFSLEPIKIQPSGTCNFSRLSKTTLNLKLSDNFVNRLGVNDKIIVNVFSINYNILKLKNGLAGLAFNF